MLNALKISNLREVKNLIQANLKIIVIHVSLLGSFLWYYWVHDRKFAELAGFFSIFFIVDASSMTGTRVQYSRDCTELRWELKHRYNSNYRYVFLSEGLTSLSFLLLATVLHLNLPLLGAPTLWTFVLGFPQKNFFYR